MKLRLLGDVWSVGPFRIADGASRIGVAGSDLCLANLETPVCPSGATPRSKAGPHISGDASSLSVFGAHGGRVCFNLANNHMMDYGDDGLRETLGGCGRFNILSAGAGGDLEKARAPARCEVGGLRVAVLGRCESQFGIATSQQAGAAPLDATIYASIRKLKSEADVVVVSVHGGAEMCPWPSPHWQDLLRSIVDAGAAVVHGHHSHVPQGYEEYHGGAIFYGLGNFLVEPEEWRDAGDTLWSVVGEARLSGKGVEELLVGTSEIEDGDPIVVRESDADETAAHEEYLACANRPLADRALLTGLWQESAVRTYRLCNAKWLGFEREKSAGRGARGKLHSLVRSVRETLAGHNYGEGDSPSRDKLLLWYHLFACDSHRDMIATALGVLGGELEDMRTAETEALADEMMPWSCACQVR